MRIRHFVLFLVLILFINTQCALYEKVKNTAGETREEVMDSAKENVHKGKDYVSEKLEEAGDTMKEMYHRVRDASSETLEDIKDAVGGTYEKVKNVGNRIIGRSADAVGEKVNLGKESVKDAYYTGKRKFNKYTNMLEDAYYIGWDKLDRMYRNGKLSVLDFKDLLGEKYDDFCDYIGVKVEQGKEAITPRSSRRVRDIYELLWDNIDELISNGKLNADQIKEFFGDKYEEVKEKGKDALDVDSKDLDRWKKTLLNWKNQLLKPEEKTTWWTNFMNKFTNMKDTVRNYVGNVDTEREDFGNYGWEILNSLITSKKLKMDDLKDILGDNFDSICDYLKKGDFGEICDFLKNKVVDTDKVSKSVGDNAKWLHETFQNFGRDLFEGDNFNLDYLYEVVLGFIPDEGLAGKSKKEITKDIDNLKDTIIQLKEKFIGESHPKTYWERFTDKVSSVTDSAKEKLGIRTKSRPRRVFDKATSKLENLYNIGWDKLAYFFKNGKLGLEDFKDLLGDKYEDIFSFITEKLEVGKEGIEDVMVHGKRIMKNPERLRDIYELIWDYVDEQYRKGSIGFEQIKDLIGDNFEDIADTVVSGIDKGKDVIKSATGSDQFDVELDRLKRKILEMKNTLSEHTEGGFWANFVNMINNFKNRAFGTNKNRQPAGRSSWSNSRSRENQDTSSTEL